MLEEILRNKSKKYALSKVFNKNANVKIKSSVAKEVAEEYSKIMVLKALRRAKVADPLNIYNQVMYYE